jgi:multidrug resistance efflux pump
VEKLPKVGFWALMLAGAVVVSAALVGVVRAVRSSNAHAANGTEPIGLDPDDDHGVRRIPVKVIRPKRDPSFVISVQALATVEPFFKDEIRARVAGQVKYVQKNLNDRVRKGELLVEIDVPDLLQEVAQKEAFIFQRRKEFLLAQAQERNAQTFIEIAEAAIDEKVAEVKQAEATRDVRQYRYDRAFKLYTENVLEKNVVDEEKRDFDSAVAACDKAVAAVKRARAEKKEKESNLKIAEADRELKESLIAVAQRDRDRVKSLADYAEIVAPYDGVVVARNVSVGNFVQNAATAQTAPMLTIARTDIVTVVMKVPDNAAPYVTTGTDAIIQIDELPGVVIRGKVTRFAPAIESKDRTQRVEVDLYNGSREDYDRFVAQAVSTQLAPLAGASLLGFTTLRAVSQTECAPNTKGDANCLPLFPQTGRAAPLSKPLMPGNSGYMRLLLRQFQDPYLLPSSAVFSRGGKPYVLAVQEGVTRLLPVHVLVSDGKLVKVVVIERETHPTFGDHEEVVRELRKDELIVVSRQVEIGEGQLVQVTEESW